METRRKPHPPSFGLPLPALRSVLSVSPSLSLSLTCNLPFSLPLLPLRRFACQGLPHVNTVCGSGDASLRSYRERENAWEPLFGTRDSCGGRMENRNGSVLPLPGLQTPTPTRGDGERARTRGFSQSRQVRRLEALEPHWETLSLGAGPEEGIEAGRARVERYPGLQALLKSVLLVLAAPGGTPYYCPLFTDGAARSYS